MSSLQGLSTVKVIREPFPYVVIDNVLDSDLAHQVEREFPNPEEMPRHSTDYQLLDGWHTNPHDSTLAQRSNIKRLFRVLESPELRKQLAEVFNIEQPVFYDPNYIGAGLLAAKKGGVHKIHRDRNRHLNTHFYLRLILLVYFNRDWQPGYGGELNLWDKKIKESVVIPPLFNRCVIFENTGHAFHSICDLNLPDGMLRKAVNFYYYTEKPAPSEQNTHIRDTEFFASPGQQLEFWKYVTFTRFPTLLIDTAINRNELASKLLQRSGLRSLYLRSAAALLKRSSPKNYQRLMRSGRWKLIQEPDERLIEQWKKSNSL